ncbi:MAG: hypothetical protein ACX936_21550, partial [Marinobacter sp.]
LEMHIGREGVDGGKSKTEAMFFPKSLQPDLYKHNFAHEKVQVGEGHITYTRKFKYLGSWITEDLRDDEDTSQRLQKAAKAMGKIRHLLHDKHTSMRTKRLLYEATVINTLIWGCESWTMSEMNRRRLDSFHHKCIRSIFRLTMHDVKEHRLSNHNLRAWFDNARKPSDTITLRQANWIHKLAQRTLEDHPTPQLILAWTDEPRKPGHPQKSFKNAFANTIAKTLGLGDAWQKTGRAEDWIEDFRDDAVYASKIATWTKSTTSEPETPVHMKAVLEAVKQRRKAWRDQQLGRPNAQPATPNPGPRAD